MLIKINGIGTVRTGVAQASPHGSVKSAPRLCFVSLGQVLQRRLPSEVSATLGFRQSSQMSAEQPTAMSEHACLGAKSHLNPEVKDQVGKPIPFFPSCWEVCTGAAQSLHMPNIAALPQAKSPRTSIPVLQNQDSNWNQAARPGTHPHLLPTSLRQELEGCFFFFFFPP